MRRLCLLAALMALLPLPARASSPGTWVPSYDVTTSQLQTIAAFDEGIGYLAYADSTIHILRTDDDGATWHDWSQLSGAHLVRFATRDVVWAYDEERAFEISRDSGKTWHDGPEIPLAETQSVYASDFAISRDGKGMALTGTVQDKAKEDCIGLRGDAIFWSRDAGQHWRRYQFPDPPTTGKGFAPYIHAVDAYSRDVGLAVGTSEPGNCTAKGGGNNTVWVTTDAGRTWRTVLKPAVVPWDSPTGGPSSPVVSVATYVAAHTILVGWSDGSLWVSHDDGKHFSHGQKLVTRPVNVGYDGSDWIAGIAFLGPVGYVTTYGGAVWRSTDSGRTWTRDTTAAASGATAGMARVAIFDADHAILRYGNFADEVVEYRLP